MKGGKGNKANDEGQVDAYFDKLEKAGARRGQPEDLDMDENTQSQAFTGRVRRLGVRLDAGAVPDVDTNLSISRLPGSYLE